MGTTNTPMPAAWCNARRAEIQKYVDGDGRRNAQETRTYLIELLAQLKQVEAENIRLTQETHNWSAAEKKDKAAHQLELTEVTVKYEGKLNVLRGKLALIRATATRGVPCLINLAAIDRILEEEVRRG